MSKRTIIRRYPSFWAVPLKSRLLQVKVLDSIDTRTTRIATDSSVEAEANAWVYEVNKVHNKEFVFYIDFIIPREKDFIKLLVNDDFSDNEPSESAQMLYRLQRKSPTAVKDWMLQLFFTFQDNEDILLQMLRLLQCFPIEKLYPASLAMAAVSLHHRSDYVKSEALSMLDHWGRHPAVLKFINNQEPPEAGWLRIKFESIKKALNKNVAIQENR
jgi:hypothetical protein